MSLFEKINLILFYSLIIKSIILDSSNSNIQNQILKDILSGESPLSDTNSGIKIKIDYNKNIRPKGKTENVLKIKISFSLRQIVSLDQINQILTTTSYLKFRWNDPRLIWNSSNINYFNILIKN